MKILLMSRSFSFVGGAESHTFLLATELKRLGNKILIVTQSLTGKTESNVFSNANVLGVDFQDFKESTNQLIEIIQKRNIDVVHVHDALSALSAASAKRSFHVPLICTAHDFSLSYNLEDKRVQLTDFLASKISMDAVIAVSNYAAVQLEQNGFEKEIIHIIYNGVDTERFTPNISGEKVRKQFQLDKKIPLITCAARLAKEKGIDILIKAIPEVLTEFPNAKVLITGNGSILHKTQLVMKKKLDALIKDLNIEDNILFGKGRFTYQEMPQVYNASDIIVVASRYGEMFGMAAAEAMACGRPVIASNTCALPEVIGSEKHGILFKPEDHQALAKQICRLLMNQKLRKTIGRNARERANKKFNIKRMAQETFKLYEQIHKRYIQVT